MTTPARRAPCFVVLLLAATALARSGELPPELTARIDQAAREVLAATAVPSASIAVVSDGRVAYVQAYGDARLEPKVAARPAMRYSIGSISKQFTATAVLMLAEEGKLSLDDPVARFLPTLTRAGEVRIRQLLSHTSGYQDYWPQDYVPPFMLQEVVPDRILDRWARRPLDFDPGTEWQYSNTGYVIAGLIVEKASGLSLMKLLDGRVFAPLGMQSPWDVDRNQLREPDPVGYLRYALGPPRVAPKEGRGWLFAAGELAMTAEDLARWNVGTIERRLLSPASYREMQADVRLANGLSTGYGLGLDVGRQSGHRSLGHGGEVSGFTASNLVFPDDRAAVTVLTNQDSIGAAGALSRRIASLLFDARDATGAAEARARRILEGLQHGEIDRSLLTDDARSYFTEEALRDCAASLAPLGAPKEVKQTSRRDRGGMTFRLFEATFAGRTLEIWERDMPDGAIEQFQVMARD